MKYRGYKIDDRINVYKSTRLPKYCSDGLSTISLTSEDLKELLEAVENKEKELESSGIPHDDICVTVVMTGESEQYNPNGADWEASFETEISWSEPESDEESKKRIEKTKSRIDQGIEIERKKKEDEERQKRKSLEQAIQLVEQSGFKVLQ
jgi:hypothetical protein